MNLRSALATPEGKRQYVGRLFATIADRYDLITRLLSFGQDRRWKRRLMALAAIRPDDRVLDVACGTGDLMREAAVKSPRVVGLDLTFRMLEHAAKRWASRLRADLKVRPYEDGGCEGGDETARGGLKVRLQSRPAGHLRLSLVAGDMQALPFGDDTFDLVTTGYGLRNVPDLGQAIGEIRRVLAPGGRLLSLDFDRPRSRAVRIAYFTYLTVVGSLLGLALHGDPDTYRYIPESIRTYPGARAVATLLEEHGFIDVRVVPVFCGLMAIHVARKGLTGTEPISGAMAPGRRAGTPGGPVR